LYSTMQQQQQQQQQQSGSFMPEKDLLYTILCELKRSVREYTTATTESNCPAVRQMFTELTTSSLTMQGRLYTLMKQQNMYNTASPALRQEIDKQLKQYSQDGQKTSQFVQQKMSASKQGYAQQAPMFANNYQQSQHQQQQHMPYN